MAMEILSKIFDCVVPCIIRQFGYIFYYKGYLERLKTELEKLEGRKYVVQHYVDEDKRNGKEIENIVQNWLKNVDSTVTKAKEIADNEGHADAPYNIPNLCARYWLGRKAEEVTQEISEVLAEGKFDRISYHNAPQGVLTPLGRGYEALNSRTSMLKDIMLALKDPNMFIIGVYGMGGVGKTTLVKGLAWQADKDGSFGVVVMATITDSPNVEYIQGQIADALDLKCDKETKVGRARKLSERISKEKRILIILDDIWGSLDLVEVGIPFGEEHKGCKLVVTSRDRHVLNREMGTQKEFSLKILPEEDSWKLFEKMAGDAVKEINIKPIALQLAKCRAGLPLSIVTVAKALRKKDVSAWRDALNQLERFDQEGSQNNKVYSSLKLSYDCLESDELKSLFLFIGSFGLSAIHTGALFLCCWVLRLYRNVPTLTQARNRHYSLIDDLRASSLLLESKWDSVRMHDLVRDTAKSIAPGVHPTYVVQRHTEIKEWPNVDQLKKCHCISVPSSYIHQLPEKLECPELKLLLLHNMGDHLKVPDQFFSGMRELKLLRLHGMMFNPSPPPSLRLLTKIQALDLSDSMLRDIAILAELTSLEILILERSDIKDLPKQIGQLVRLRMLNLNNCSELRVIPANLISSLTSLEELYMGGCFFRWGIKGKSENASLDELSNLSQLKTLEIKIQDASVFPRDLRFFEKLENYSIFIGGNWKWPLRWSCGTSEPSRVLKLTESNSTSILLDHGFTFLLKTVEDMSLSGVTCVRDVLYELNREGFPQLKHLHIQCSSELKYIIDSMGRVHLSSAFPNLETLAFQNLVNLEDVCHGLVPPRSFTKLQKIEVRGCDKLKNVLSYSLVRGLPQLLEIKISECKLMTEVIAEQTLEEGNNKVDKIVFPKLHSLTLECLPSLTSFYSSPSTANVGSVALFDQKVEMPDLKTLELSNINSCKLWDGQLSGHSSIQSLTSLTIDKCGNIAYVFSSSVARELANLQYLQISNCQMLEEIFALDGNLSNLASAHESLSDEEAIFPNLETLVISHMDHLKSVWHNQLTPNSLCKLKKLETKFCNKLSNVIPSHVLSKLQNLETMTVINCPALEVVFEMQDLNTRVDSQAELQMQLRTLTLEHLPMLKHIWSRNSNRSFRFQNLCQVKVTECESLNHVFPLSVAKELPHLQVLYVENCGMENIVVAQDEMAETVPIHVFPELTSLSLRSLKKLRSFSHSLHTLDCPVLAELDVFHCDQLELFMPKSLNHQEIVPVDPQPLLSFEKVIPNLRELTLSGKDVTMLCNGQLNDELIYLVKAVRLRCFHDNCDKFPSAFLQKFINLENLKVTCSSFTEIFSSGSFGTGHSETSMMLRSFTLFRLNNLEFICEGNSEIHPVLQNLESLRVFRCPRLKSIVPSLMLFQNLGMIWVEGCAGLENIMTPSSGASLPKLKKLSIVNCDMIEEIVASNDGSDASEIAFMKLERLQLINLPRLKSFCKGRYSFKFPLLDNLFVIDCPVMETFSHGVLNATKLREVYVKPKKDWRWNGDLNTTIQTFFRETNSREG